MSNYEKGAAMSKRISLLISGLWQPAGAILAGIVILVLPSWGLADGDPVSIDLGQSTAATPASGGENAVTTPGVAARRPGSRIPSESPDQSDGEDAEEAEDGESPGGGGETGGQAEEGDRGIEGDGGEEEEAVEAEEAEERDEEGGGDIDPRKNLIAQHDSQSKEYKKNCSECHRDIHSRQSMDPSVPTAHRVMFPFAAGRPGDDKQCMWCHQTVDLVQGTQHEDNSFGSLRRYTDVLLCTLCHGPYRGPGTQLYQGGLSPADPDGPLLYRLACAGCHGPLESSKVSGEDADDIRKKIDENEGGMGPLSVLTTAEIEAIAAALAE